MTLKDYVQNLNSVPVGQIDARNSKQKIAGHLGPNNANLVAHMA